MDGEHVVHHHGHGGGRRSLGALAGGSMAEGLAGAAAVVLAIIGLAGIEPGWMTAIACIAAGCALLFEGAAVGATLGHYDRERKAGVGGGVTAESLAGAAAVVLGILALVGIEPALLLQISAIVLGGGILLGGAAVSQARHAGVEHHRYGAYDAAGHPVAGSAHHEDRAQHGIDRGILAASGLETLAGIGAAVLGILALVGVGDPLVLTLVAFLVVGGAVLLSGSALGAKAASVLRR